MTMWELLFLVLFFILFVSAAAWESFEFGLLVLVAFGVVSWGMDFQLLEWLIANPITVIVGLLVYASVGGIWSVLKWRLWLGSQEEAIARSWNSFKERVLSSRTGVPGKDEGEQLSNLRELFWKESSTGYWTASRNKRRITAWISLWPASLVWTIVNDLVVKLWERVYQALVGLYDRIAKGIVDRNLK